MRQAHIPSGRAASRTVRQRSQSLSNFRQTVSAQDPASQLAHEVLSTPEEERKKLLEEIKRVDFVIKVPVRTSLAMKADMSIPWNQLKLFRR